MVRLTAGSSWIQFLVLEEPSVWSCACFSPCLCLSVLTAAPVSSTVKKNTYPRLTSSQCPRWRPKSGPRRCTAAAHCSAQEEKSNAADKDHPTSICKCRKQGVSYLETGSAEVVWLPTYSWRTLSQLLQVIFYCFYKDIKSRKTTFAMQKTDLCQSSERRAAKRSITSSNSPGSHQNHRGCMSYLETLPSPSSTRTGTRSSDHGWQDGGFPAGIRSGRCSVAWRSGTHSAKLRETGAVFTL